MINVGFIGAGNMGYAIMKGMCAGALTDACSIYASPSHIRLFAADADTSKYQRLTELGVTVCATPQELVQQCKYVFLSVKPQNLEELLPQIKDSLTADTVIVSICAGISGDYIKTRTSPATKVVLVMPNTPLLLGEGASALAKVAPTTDEEFTFVREIFAACGTAEEIAPDKMKEIIAVNGSSPAFIYLFAKAFVDYAVSAGIDAQTAKKLFAKTLTGSAKMLTDSGNTIDELIAMVSSKGGTTIAGLDALRAGGFEQTIESACKACTNRAYELAQ
ncbi:MAG: pyrroline-5-carboxylate reductase [Oscillospiraceae bacterium]